MKTLLPTLFYFLFFTQIVFTQWVQIGLNEKSIKDIAVQNSIIFAVTSDSGKVYRSFDGGNNWALVVDSCAVDIDLTYSGEVFMILDSLFFTPPWPISKWLFSSSDAGITWKYINIIEQLDSVSFPNTIRVSPTGTVFCGVKNGPEYWYDTGIARSTDNGLSWTGSGWINAGEIYDFLDNYVITHGSYLYAFFGHGDYIHLSEDEGVTWILLGDLPYVQFDPSCHALNLFTNPYVDIGVVFGSCDGLFLSIDSCQSWTQCSALSISAGLSLEDNYMFVGTDNLGVFLFHEGIDSLGSFNEGLTNLNIHTFEFDENHNVYIGTDSGLWRRPLSEIIVSAEEVSNTLPSNFSLSQNYPNPFNPNTNIKFIIPSAKTRDRVFVQLKVYDVLGNENETLVDEEKQAGTYEITWYAEGLPSGVYFYQLKAGSFTETKKMLLIR